ncbi:MAG: hypothetical protein JO247_08255 [Chloroflexi bacterium]|nr:hypothetical protein [Chloroflexota bacterium]
MAVADPAAAEPVWLIRNYGPRCTLVSAASVLQWLGASSADLVSTIEDALPFHERSGPSVFAYVGGHSALDRGIERAAAGGGIRVRSRTRFVVRFADIARSIDEGAPVVLNCYRAPSGQWSHSIVATAYARSPRRLLTVDPNDGQERWLTWLRPTSGWVCTATFIQPLASATLPPRRARAG